MGRTGLACDPAKLSAIRNWHAPDKVKGVRQFVGFDSEGPDLEGSFRTSTNCQQQAFVPLIHPFSVHKLDAGPVCLMTIVHVFNYRMAVLHDGVKSAVRVGRSRKAEGRFLSGSDIPWGQQVAVMFQIVSTVALELPSFLAELENLRGISANVHLHCEPWGHINHEDIKGLFTPKTRVFSAAEILLRIYQNPIHLDGTRWRTRFWRQREVRRRKNVVRQRAPFKCMGF